MVGWFAVVLVEFSNFYFSFLLFFFFSPPYLFSSPCFSGDIYFLTCEIFPPSAEEDSDSVRGQ